jgi:hypothetical protein
MTSLDTSVTLVSDVILLPGEEDGEADRHPCGIFLFILYGPMFGSVCFLGVLGNTISFILLHKYSPNSVSSYLLKALAVADNMFLIAASGVQIYPAMLMYLGAEDSLVPIYPYIQTYAWPLVHMAQMASVWMTVLVAGNRYVAVCKPLHAQYLCTKGRVRTQMWVVILLAIVYNIPRFFEYKFVMVSVGELNSTVPTTSAMQEDNIHELLSRTTSSLTTTAQDAVETVTIQAAAQQAVNVGLASLPLYNIVYENISYCLFVFFLPLSVLIFFNAHLVNALKTARRQRKRILVKAAAKTTATAVAADNSRDGTTTTTYGSSSAPPSRATSSVAAPRLSTLSTTSQQLQQRTAVVVSKRAATSADENNVTLVMIVIVLVFIVCETPAALNQILYYVFVKDAGDSQCTHYVRFYNICNLLVVLNSSLNFVIYCLFRRQFQQQLAELCLCQRQRRVDRDGGEGVRGRGTTYEPSVVGGGHHRLRATEEVEMTDSGGRSITNANTNNGDLSSLFRSSALPRYSAVYVNNSACTDFNAI